MLGIIGAGIVFTFTLIFSLAKASSKGERLAEQHREELLARKNNRKKLADEESTEQKMKNRNNSHTSI